MEHEKTSAEQAPSEDNDRRNFLKKCGKFAAITPPTITMLLSTSLTSNAIASSSKGPRTRGDNGVGNGLDLQPPGNPPINDDTGTGPGNPGNKGGKKK
jgi:hypothetical protein